MGWRTGMLCTMLTVAACGELPESESPLSDDDAASQPQLSPNAADDSHPANLATADSQASASQDGLGDPAASDSRHAPDSDSDSDSVADNGVDTESGTNTDINANAIAETTDTALPASPVPSASTNVANVADVANAAAHQVARDWAAAKDVISIRLLPASPAFSSSRYVIGDALPGLSAVIVLDVDDAIVVPPREATAAWGQDDRTLFAIAAGNLDTRLKPKPKSFDVRDVAGQKIHVLESGSVQTASLAFTLAQRKDAIGPHGAVVALPDPYHVIWTPIHDQRAIKAIAPLIATADEAAKRTPDAFGNHLYWLTTDGRFVRLPYRRPADDSNGVDGGTSVNGVTDTDADHEIVFEPPQSFIDMARQLAPY